MRTYLFVICVTVQFIPGKCIAYQTKPKCPGTAPVIKEKFSDTVDHICSRFDDYEVSKFLIPEPILCSAVKYLSWKLCESNLKLEESHIENAKKKSEHVTCKSYKEMALKNYEMQIPQNYNKLFENEAACEKTCKDIMNETHPLCTLILFAKNLLSPEETKVDFSVQNVTEKTIYTMDSVSSVSPSNERLVSPSNERLSSAISLENQKSLNQAHVSNTTSNTSSLPAKGKEGELGQQVTEEIINPDKKMKTSAVTANSSGAENDSAHILSENTENTNNHESTMENGSIQKLTGRTENSTNQKGEVDAHVELDQESEVGNANTTVQAMGSKEKEQLKHQDSGSEPLSDKNSIGGLNNPQITSKQKVNTENDYKLPVNDPQKHIEKPLDEKQSTENIEQVTKEDIESQNTKTVHEDKVKDKDAHKATQSNRKSNAKVGVTVNNVPMTSVDDLPISKENYPDNTAGDLAEMDTRYPVDNGEFSDNADFFSGGGTGVYDARPVSSLLHNGGGTGVDDFQPASEVLNIVKTGMDPGTAVVRDNYKYDSDDSHFFAYFMTTMIFCIVGYLLFHNKQKILALALEGRARRGRRRPNTSGYRKLDSNLEEAIGSSKNSSVTQIIY